MGLDVEDLRLLSLGGLLGLHRLGFGEKVAASRTCATLAAGGVGKMRLFHGTTPDAWKHIEVEGLRGRIPKSEGGWGLVYLAPTAESASAWGAVVLEVETGDLRLTAFQDCKEWEVLCWGEIPPEQIRLVGALGK